jgi:hypothetical protein
MPRLRDEIGCTQDELRILCGLCADQGHKIHCQHCQTGQGFINLQFPPGFVTDDLGGWLCPDCQSDLKGAIKEHITRCKNFPP